MELILFYALPKIIHLGIDKKKIDATKLKKRKKAF